MTDSIVMYEQLKDIKEQQNQIEEKIDMIFGIITGQITPEDITKEEEKETKQEENKKTNNEIELPDY